MMAVAQALRRHHVVAALGLQREANLVEFVKIGSRLGEPVHGAGARK